MFSSLMFIDEIYYKTILFNKYFYYSGKNLLLSSLYESLLNKYLFQIRKYF